MKNKTEQLEDLGALLKSTDSEDTAVEIINDFCETHNIEDSGDVQEKLTEYNCFICDKCGLYFGEDELSENDTTCIFCYEEK